MKKYSHTCNIYTTKQYQKRIDENRNAIILVESGTNNSNSVSSSSSKSHDPSTSNYKDNRGSS